MPEDNKKKKVGAVTILFFILSRFLILPGRRLQKLSYILKGKDTVREHRQVCLFSKLLKSIYAKLKSFNKKIIDYRHCPITYRLRPTDLCVSQMLHKSEDHGSFHAETSWGASVRTAD